jgi:hypothetical protein
VLTGDQVLIGGFIISGTDPKKVLICGIGPLLNGGGVTLFDLTLELHEGSTTVTTNDNWKIDEQTQQSQEADIEATTIPPTNDLESAILVTLTVGFFVYFYYSLPNVSLLKKQNPRSSALMELRDEE